ncbi:MAG: YdcF family protein [Clostridia bacterium]|nr:YdcF family protein [Clostridia bacterium]
MAGVNSLILHRGNEYLRTEEFAGNSYDGILVLGAGLRSDGTPSDMLRDRLQVAVDLYRKGVAPYIILSGDCSGEDYDEVSAMEKYCLAQGIPSEALRRDDSGFSTYESMFNLRQNGGGRILVVTQRYHLYRALFIAREMGMEADGCPSDPRSYRGQFLRDIREIGARVKDYFKVTLFF